MLNRIFNSITISEMSKSRKRRHCRNWNL